MGGVWTLNELAAWHAPDGVVRHCISRDEWLDQLPTSGFWGQIPAAGQRELLAGVGAAIDAAGGSFTVHYATVTVTAAQSGAN
jgi:hypothetical protein